MASQAAADTHALELLAPPAALCTDNGAMIAWAGIERLRAGLCEPAPAAGCGQEPVAETLGPGSEPSRADAAAEGAEERERTLRARHAHRDEEWVEVRPRWPLTDRRAPLLLAWLRSA